MMNLNFNFKPKPPISHIPAKSHIKLFFQSIRFKLWGAMVLIIATALILIYILGVVLLEKQYLKKKVDDITGIVSTITSQLKDEDYDNLSSYLYELALKNNICIDISNSSGSSVIYNEGLGKNCFMHSTFGNKYKFLNTIYESPNSIVMTNVNDKASEIGYLVSGIHKTESGLDYTLIVTASLAPIKETTAIIASQLMSISLIVLIFATILSFAISIYITKPIKKLNTAIGKVTTGDLDTSVIVNGNDEIAQLSNNFNYMVKQISTTNAIQKELVANVSHDLKTPLTMIKGYAELIKDITGDDKEKRKNQLDIIVEESDRLSLLVSDITDLSLLQSGIKKINIEEFCITQLVTSVINRFDYYTQNFDYKFITNVPSETIVVSADKTRIEQVLYNLINNAVAHIGIDKTIIVSLTQSHTPNSLVKIEIIDHGEGINPDELTLIWDRYYKPFRTAQNESKGTGLGLSIVKTILTAHNVPFGVSSALNKGSNFWFSLNKSNEADDA